MNKDFLNIIITPDTKHAATTTELNDKLMLSFKDYINYFPNFQNVFFWNTYDKNDKKLNCVISPSIKKVLGYSVDEYKKLTIEKRYLKLHDRETFLKKIKAEKIVRDFPLTLKKKDGSFAYIEMDCELIAIDSEQDGNYGLRGVFKDLTKKVKEHLRKEIAFKIAEKSQRRLINLNLLGKYIYETLKDVIHLSNLYIAMLDEEKTNVIFPYFKDKYAKKDSFKAPYHKNGFTEHIINIGKTVLFNSKKENEDFHKKHSIIVRGKVAENLLGIPLKSDGLTIGVLVVQNYSKNILNKEDIELLKFVAAQIATTIDRKLWQEKLVVNEEYFRSLTENSSEIIGIINEEGTIEYVSKSVFKILKYYSFELIGKNISNFIKEDAVLKTIKKIITSTVLNEVRILKIKDKKGVKKYLEISISKNSINNINKGIIFNAKDITSRVILEKKEEVAQKRLTTLHAIEKTLIANQSLEKILTNAIQVLSKNAFDVDRLDICLINQPARNFKIIAHHTKYKGKEKIDTSKVISFDEVHFIDTILEKKAFKISNLQQYPLLKRKDKKIAQEGIQSAYIAPIIIKNKVIGTLNMASKTKNYFENIDAKLVKEITILLAVIINDSILKNEITERKNDLTNIFNNANEGIIRIDSKGKFLDANAKTLQLFGYSYIALLNLSVLDITFPKDIKKSKKIMLDLKTRKAKELTFEKRYIHQSGKIINCSVTAKAIFNANQEFEYFLGLITDITDFKKATKQVDNLKNALNNSASIVLTDCNGKIIDSNDSIFEKTGYTKKELIGQTPRIFRSGGHSASFYKMLWATILSGHTWKGEIKNKKKDGTDYWLFTTITPIFNENRKIEQFLAIRFDITEEKKAKANLIKEVIEAQEKERERFAMEIHDGLGQTLLAAKMNFNTIGEHLENCDKEVKIIYDNAIHLLTEAVHEARNISHGLMSRVLNNFGLAYAINEIVNNINISSKLKFIYQHNIEQLRFNEEIEMGVYRTLQELIKNIIKHSEASNAYLKITKKDDTLLILIEDNGIGIDKQSIVSPKSGGIGLKNMRSRIEYLGGQFIIDDKLEKGTRININISLN